MTEDGRRNSLPGVDWEAALAALRVEVARVVALVRSVRRPDAHAVGGWTVAELAMHLTQGWLIVPSLAAATCPPSTSSCPNGPGVTASR